MGTEVYGLHSTRRLGRFERPWTIALTLGLLVAGCGGAQSPDQTTRSLVPEAFATCMTEAGYSFEDFAHHFDPPTAEELEEGRHGPVDGEGGIDWEFERQFGACVNQSGIGESVVGDPEVSARNTEIALALTRCMRGRGWSEFPDPTPHPAPYDDGLVHARIDVPADPEARGAFNADLMECGVESGMHFSFDNE